MKRLVLYAIALTASVVYLSRNATNGTHADVRGTTNRIPAASTAK